MRVPRADCLVSISLRSFMSRIAGCRPSVHPQLNWVSLHLFLPPGTRGGTHRSPSDKADGCLDFMLWRTVQLMAIHQSYSTCSFMFMLLSINMAFALLLLARDSMSILPNTIPPLQSSYAWMPFSAFDAHKAATLLQAASRADTIMQPMGKAKQPPGPTNPFQLGRLGQASSLCLGELTQTKSCGRQAALFRL